MACCFPNQVCWKHSPTGPVNLLFYLPFGSWRPRLLAGPLCSLPVARYGVLIIGLGVKLWFPASAIPVRPYTGPLYHQIYFLRTFQVFSEPVHDTANLLDFSIHTQVQFMYCNYSPCQFPIWGFSCQTFLCLHLIYRFETQFCPLLCPIMVQNPVV